MSQLSCINALKEILDDAGLGIQTIKDIESVMPTLPADQAPYVVIQDRNIREKRLSGGFGGSKQVDFFLDCHLFVYYSSIDDVTTEAFRTLVDRVQAVIRNSHRLNNLGDTDNSQVLFFGEKLETSISDWTQDNSGIFLRHAVITADVMEVAVDTVDY